MPRLPLSSLNLAWPNLARPVSILTDALPNSARPFSICADSFAIRDRIKPIPPVPNIRVFRAQVKMNCGRAELGRASVKIDRYRLIVDVPRRPGHG